MKTIRNTFRDPLRPTSIIGESYSIFKQIKNFAFQHSKSHFGLPPAAGAPHPADPLGCRPGPDPLVKSRASHSGPQGGLVGPPRHKYFEITIPNDFPDDIRAVQDTRVLLGRPQWALTKTLDTPGFFPDFSIKSCRVPGHYTLVSGLSRWRNGDVDSSVWTLEMAKRGGGL